MATPIEQIKKQITDLELERETMRTRFIEIEQLLERARKQVDVWEMIESDPALQAKLIEQMVAAKLVEG